MAPHSWLVALVVLTGAPRPAAAFDCEVVTKTVFECTTDIECPASKPFGQGYPNCQVSATCNPDISFNVLSGTSVNPKAVQVISGPFSPNDNELRCSWSCCDADVNGKSQSGMGTMASTSTGTRTMRGTETQTQTQARTQTQIHTGSVSRLSTSTTKSGEAEDSEQNQLLENQRRMLEGAGKQGITIGVANCLDAANELAEPRAGAEPADKKLERCKQELAEGGRMVGEAAKRKGGLSGGLADEEQLRSERSQAIFARFEKLYGTPGEALARRMLASGVNLEELKGALRERFGEEKAAEWLKDADAQKFVMEAGKGRKSPAAKKPGLREALREAMDQAPNFTPGESRSARPRKERPVTPIDLTPLDKNQLVPEEDSEEFTLFQVVNRRYRSYWPRMLPYREPRP